VFLLFRPHCNGQHKLRPTATYSVVRKRLCLFRVAVSVLVGPCCPDVLKLCRCKCAYCCIRSIGQINDDEVDSTYTIRYEITRCYFNVRSKNRHKSAESTTRNQQLISGKEKKN